MDIAGKFVNNSEVGKLFVITGNAMKEYDHPHGLIRVTGKLYSKGKKLENTEMVFGGNMLSDTELARLDLGSIKKRLANRATTNKTDLNPTSGREVPFMIVFSDLPDNVKEYEIEADLLVPIQAD